MLNDKPCKNCVHYDPIVLGAGGKNANRGWCAKKSLYHYKDQPGQVVPDGVKRVDNEALQAQPFIVIGSKVQINCTDYKAIK